jgi:hypothetical protein
MNGTAAQTATHALIATDAPAAPIETARVEAPARRWSLATRVAGEMDGKTIQMRLELFPRERFRLVSRGFNWIQEYPFNR